MITAIQKFIDDIAADTGEKPILIILSTRSYSQLAIEMAACDHKDFSFEPQSIAFDGFTEVLSPERVLQKFLK